MKNSLTWELGNNHNRDQVSFFPGDIFPHFILKIIEFEVNFKHLLLPKAMSDWVAATSLDNKVTEWQLQTAQILPKHLSLAPDFWQIVTNFE